MLANWQTISREPRTNRIPSDGMSTRYAEPGLSVSTRIAVLISVYPLKSSSPAGIGRPYEPRRRSVPSTRARKKERRALALHARQVPQFQASERGNGGGRNCDWCRGTHLDLPFAGIARPGLSGLVATFQIIGPRRATPGSNSPAITRYCYRLVLSQVRIIFLGARVSTLKPLFLVDEWKAVFQDAAPILE